MATQDKTKMLAFKGIECIRPKTAIDGKPSKTSKHIFRISVELV
jgi:hypothetical protein